MFYDIVSIKKRTGVVPPQGGATKAARLYVRNSTDSGSSISQDHQNVNSNNKNSNKGNDSYTMRKIAAKKKAIARRQQLQRDIAAATPHKNAQFEIIQKTNPMFDDAHTGIRSPSDIKTWAEVIEDGEGFAWGDFTLEDAKAALTRGTVTVYSSYPIKNGVFVSTSYQQALDYAAGEPSGVHSRRVALDSVAWINGDEGQYAKVYRNNNVRYDLAEDNTNNYSYETLVKKDDMVVTQLDNNVPTREDGTPDRAEVIARGMANVREQHNALNTDREAFVYVSDIGQQVRVTKRGLTHGLARIGSDTVVATMNIGDLLRNSVAVNELNGRATNKKSTDMSYVLLAVGQNDSGAYLVRMIVDKNSNSLSDISSYGLYAARAKKDGTLLMPKGNERAGDKTPFSYLRSTISISQLLENVKQNNLANEIFSSDVAEKLGVSRSKGTLSGSVRYDLTEDAADKKTAKKEATEKEAAERQIVREANQIIREANRESVYAEREEFSERERRQAYSDKYARSVAKISTWASRRGKRFGRPPHRGTWIEINKYRKQTEDCVLPRTWT